MIEFPRAVLGFAARSGTGKTTLIRKLLPLLKTQQLRVAVIKHSHHDFEIDTPGKDSYELRKAGAEQMLIASPYREVLISEKQNSAEPQLLELVNKLELDEIDLVLVEGFRSLAFPKIELYRAALDKPPLYKDDSNIIAIATDKPLEIEGLPQLDINNPAQLAQYINQWLNNSSHRR